MKAITYILLVLLLATVGFAAYFYLYTFKPMETNYQRMSSAMPDLEKSTRELKAYKAREKQETAWINPAIDGANAALGDEIKAGKAEVFSSGNKVIVNIAEGALYLHGSRTFSKESPLLRSKLAMLLKDDRVKGKVIIIGNTTQGVPGHGRGRRRVPAKDARTLAGERSAFLVKDFENNGVPGDMLVAAAYPSNQPAAGFKIKDHKTVIIIENPPVTPAAEAKKETVPAAQTQTKPVTAVPAAPMRPKPIPIQPARPKPR
jgi:hypothetical protein